MGAKDVYSRIQLREDISGMVNLNHNIADLYMNITDHILRQAGRGNLTTEPRGIGISNIAMDTNGFCRLAVRYK